MESTELATVASLRRRFLAVARDRDANPEIVMLACLSIAAAVAKTPPPGVKELHLNRFVKLCRDVFKATAGLISSQEN